MKSKITIAAVTAVFAVLGAVTLYAQDKYTLKSPSGIAFSDFKGYEDWSVVSSARTEEVLKVIVANPAMIKAFKSGVPGNGQPFPEGSRIVKLQWKPKKSTEAPFVVDVPDVFSQAFVMEKDSRRFPKTGGWGYAVFNYDAASDKFTADPKSLSDCGQRVPCGRKGKGLHFPSVPEALNRTCPPSNRRCSAGIALLFRHRHGNGFAGAALGDPDVSPAGSTPVGVFSPSLITVTLALSPLTVSTEILPLPFSATISLPLAARMPSGPLIGWSIQISTGCPALPRHRLGCGRDCWKTRCSRRACHPGR